MGLGGVAIAILPSIICLKLTFSDGLGCLEDYIGNSIELEINELPRKDKIILWYSDCHSEFGNEYEVFDARYICTQRFNDFENKRYEELLPMLEECSF